MKNKYDGIPEVKEYFDMLGVDKSARTIETYLTGISKIFDYLGIKTFEDISNIEPAKIREFQKDLKDKGYKPRSVNSYMRPLRAMLNWMVENEYLEKSPLARVKDMRVHQENLTYLSDEEIKEIINACITDEEQLLMAMLISLGLRRSEVANLKIEDIADGKIVVKGKGEKVRSLYIQDDVYDLMTEFLENKRHKSEYVFTSSVSDKYRPETIWRKVKTIVNRTSIDPSRIDLITTHTMRRTFASNLISNRTDLRVVQAALGHASYATTLLYANVRNSAVEEAMKNQKPLIIK